MGTVAFPEGLVEFPPWRMPITPFLPRIPDNDEGADGAARARVVKERTAKAEAALKNIITTDEQRWYCVEL